MPQRRDPRNLPLPKDDKQLAQEELYKQLNTIYTGVKTAAQNGTLDRMLGPNADFLKYTTFGKFYSMLSGVMPGKAESIAQSALAAFKNKTDKETPDVPQYMRATWRAMAEIQNSKLLELAATTFTDRTVNMIKPVVANPTMDPRESVRNILTAKQAFDVERSYHNKYKDSLHPEDITMLQGNILRSKEDQDHIDFITKWLLNPKTAKQYRDIDLNPLTITSADPATGKLFDSGLAAHRNQIVQDFVKYKSANRMLPDGERPADDYDPMYGLSVDDMGTDFVWSPTLDPSTVEDKQKNYLKSRIIFQKKLKEGGWIK
jgi:hypothetical protein